MISWQRAFTLQSLGKIEVVEEYDADVRSAEAPSSRYRRWFGLLQAFRRHKKPVKFSRVNIYARDKHRCQYCGNKAKLADLTYDHVVPRSMGGKHDVDQHRLRLLLVQLQPRQTARRKQAKMTLLSKPVQPVWVPAVSIRVSLRRRFPTRGATTCTGLVRSMSWTSSKTAVLCSWDVEIVGVLRDHHTARVCPRLTTRSCARRGQFPIFGSVCIWDAASLSMRRTRVRFSSGPL